MLSMSSLGPNYRLQLKQFEYSVGYGNKCKSHVNTYMYVLNVSCLCPSK